MAKAPTAPKTSAPPVAPPPQDTQPAGGNDTQPAGNEDISSLTGGEPLPVIAADTYAEGTPERADYDLGYTMGYGDAKADDTQKTADEASFDQGDSDAVKEGYRAGFAAQRAENEVPPQSSEPFGGKGDHDGNGTVGGAAPHIEVDWSKPTQPDDAKTVAADMLNAPGAKTAIDNGAEIVGEMAEKPEGVNDLDYDEGYRAGETHGKTGTEQRNFEKDYTFEYKRGYSDGYAGVQQGKEAPANVRSIGQIALEREQAATDSMSLEDRVRRLEQTLGLRSPGVKTE